MTQRLRRPYEVRSMKIEETVENILQTALNILEGKTLA